MQVNYNSYEYTSVKFSAQTGTSQSAKPRQEEGKESASVQNQQAATYVPSKEAMSASQRASLIDSMKASLQTSQQKLFDQVNQLLSRQGMTMRVGEGAWKVFAEGNFQVDATTKAAAQQAISEDGEWGVKKTSERLITFAKALVGGDRSKVDMMRDAFIKGYKAAEKAWGGCLPDISKQTYDATMKLFDEWEKGDSTDVSAAPENEPEKTPSSSGLSFTYEYSRVRSSSVSFSASNDDVDWLERAGILSDVSEPLRQNGLNLKSSWCTNERVSVSFTLDAAASNTEVKAGQDGFVRRGQNSGYNGNRPGSHKSGRKITVDFIKPPESESGRTVRIGDQEIATHEDGTVTVALSDGTLRRARVNQQALDRMAKSGSNTVNA